MSSRFGGDEQRAQDSSPVAMATATSVGRVRAGTALAGIVPALVAMPLLLRIWAPGWFVACWLGAFTAVSVIFVWISLTRTTRVEHAWATVSAILFCGAIVSSVTFSDRLQDYWTAVTIGVVYVAFEMSALPFLRLRQRIGALTICFTLTICGLVAVNPLLALLPGPLMATMLRATEHMRKLRDVLRDRLAVAEQAIQHDNLTGVLNRRGLANILHESAGEEITIALLDIDRFKLVNDAHGHQVGDQVLVGLAHELGRRLGDRFQIARIGGDEFVAVAPGRIPLDLRLVEPLHMTVVAHGQPFEIACRMSVGVSFGRNLQSAHGLLSEAGFAMRDAKRSGAGLSRFGDELAERLERTLEVAAVVNGNKDQGQFVPVAQTIVSDGQIVGCELLIRWERSDGELLTPIHFLAHAAEAGLMAVINDMMTEHAVRFAARFNNRPDAPFVAVNISSSHLGAIGFCERVDALLKEHRVPAERLMIEITETEQLDNNDGWEAAATELRRLGVRLAMDDFGTGYSSLERLRHLPITHLKFDRSLVQSVSGPFGQIVRGVARFAHDANIGIIAEGIETLDEWDSMRQLDISIFQGYYFHRPESLDEIETKIIENHIMMRQPNPK